MEVERRTGNFKESAFPFATVVLELFSVSFEVSGVLRVSEFQGGTVGERLEGLGGRGNRWKIICTQG